MDLSAQSKVHVITKPGDESGEVEKVLIDTDANLFIEVQSTEDILQKSEQKIDADGDSSYRLMIVFNQDNTDTIVNSEDFGKNILSKNDSETDFETYLSGERITFSEQLLSEITKGKNPKISFNINLPKSSDPIQYEIDIVMPNAILPIVSDMTSTSFFDYYDIRDNHGNKYNVRTGTTEEEYNKMLTNVRITDIIA